MPDSSAVGLAEYAFVNATQCYPACELFATPGSSDDAFATCLSTCTTPATIVTMLPSIVFTIFLVMCSGMFSGLTLGLLSLTIEGLDIVINAGSPEEKRWAERILPLRKRGNLLLCTLLLGNTLVNALIAITSAQMTSGVVGGLISTVVIVIFGEICPQAICSRHGLRIGAASVCIVRPLMIVLLPITYPIAMVLDYVLGREMGTQYSRQQLDALLEMEMAQGAVSAEDQQLLSSALRFSSKVRRGRMARGRMARGRTGHGRTARGGTTARERARRRARGDAQARCAGGERARAIARLRTRARLPYARLP